MIISIYTRYLFWIHECQVQHNMIIVWVHIQQLVLYFRLSIIAVDEY